MDWNSKIVVDSSPRPKSAFPVKGAGHEIKRYPNHSPAVTENLISHDPSRSVSTQKASKPLNQSHIPFCTHCKIHVAPQVAVVQERRVGGIIDMAGPVDALVTRGSEKVKKFCPNCGNEVHSQDDLRIAQENKDFEFNFGLTVFLIVLVITVLVVMFNV